MHKCFDVKLSKIVMKVKGKCLSTMEKPEYHLNSKGLDTNKLCIAMSNDQSFWSASSWVANIVLSLPGGQISTCS